MSGSYAVYRGSMEFIGSIYLVFIFLCYYEWMMVSMVLGPSRDYIIMLDVCLLTVTVTGSNRANPIYILYIYIPGSIWKMFDAN